MNKDYDLKNEMAIHKTNVFESTIDPLYRKRNFKFFDRVTIDGCNYFSINNYNGLFKEDLMNDEIVFIGHFPNENIYAENLHRKVLHFQGVLFFIPFNGKGISSYNLKTKQFSFTFIFNENRNVSFSQVHFYTDTVLYLIPANDEVPFTAFNMRTNKTYMYNNIWPRILKVVEKNNSVDFFSSVIYKNKIVVIMRQKSILFEINLNTETVLWWSLPKKYHLKNLALIDNEFWITLTDSYSIIQLNYETKQYVENENMYQGKRLEPYMTCIKYGNKIILLPCSEDHIAEINMKDHSINVKKNLLSKSFFRENYRLSLVMGYHVDENKNLILYPAAGIGLLEVNFDKNTIERKILVYKKFTPEFYAVLQKRNFENELKNIFVLVEGSNSDFLLENYMKFILSHNEQVLNNNLMYNGKKIWDYCKRMD